MGKNTRYDRLRSRIRRQYSRSKTFTPAIPEGDNELLFDIANPENVGNDAFLERGPFNAVYIVSTAPAPVRVYLSNDLEVYVDIQAPSGGSATKEATAVIPMRYVGYLRIENLATSTDGSGDIAEGDLHVQVGNQVDSVELDLLKMSGLLDIEDRSER